MMEQSYRKRIRGIDKHLQFYLTENSDYYLGLLFEDYLKSPLLDKYNLPKEFPENRSIVPLPRGSVTRANQKGKFVRKQPEEKEIVTRHIDYIRKSDGYRVEYDRRYNIYKKVLLHKFNAGLQFIINEHGQKVVASEKLNFTQSDSIKGTHIANMFNEIFNDFEVFDEDLNPAIHFNTRFEEIILPSGSLENDDNFKDLIDIGGRFAKNEDENKAYQKRLQILKEYNPDIRGKGSDGFYGYIVFGFTDLDIVILETMYAGNATYVFSTENFQKNIIKDKQTVLNSKLHEERFFHRHDWEAKLRKFMKKKMEKN